MSFFGPYGPLDYNDIEALNTIARFLAINDLGDEEKRNATAFDLVVLAGNALVWTLEGR